jgi:cytidylate kinase
MIVTVSRQFGSDGERVARAAASELGLTVVDRAYVRNAALEAGVSAELLQRLMYEGQRTVAEEIIQGLSGVAPDAATAAASNPLLGVFAPLVSTETADLRKTAEALGAIIRERASHGNVLVLGQGSQALLRGQRGACHVLFIAPLETRIARVAAWHKVSLAEARRRVRDEDMVRRDYLARYHDIRWLDPLLYHLVINTGEMPMEGAVALLVRAAQTLATLAASP